jgi:hypothetical protein
MEYESLNLHDSDIIRVCFKINSKEEDPKW